MILLPIWSTYPMLGKFTLKNNVLTLLFFVKIMKLPFYQYLYQKKYNNETKFKSILNKNAI